MRGPGAEPASAARAPAAGSAEQHFAKAMTLLQAQRLEDALLAFDRALLLSPRSVAVLFNRGGVLSDLGRHDEALAAFDRAIAVEPRFVDAHVSRALALAKLGRAKLALTSIDVALRLDSGSFDAQEARADLLRDQGRSAEALVLYERLSALQPGSVGVLNSQGIALQNLGRLIEALAVYDAALRIEPDFPPALTNRGVTLTRLGRYEEALACYEKALRVDPDFASAHLNKGTCRLILGDFALGWKEYEWRWRSAWWKGTQGFYGRRTFDRPLWLGKQSLAGKTIFLHPEQGLGDTVQFSRYARLLADRGAQVVLEVQPQLRALLGGLAGVSQLSAVGEAVPAHDFHCPLMSLPLACDTRLDSIPAASGYLQPELLQPRKVDFWRDKLGTHGRRRIGLVWSGNATHRNDANRSIPFAKIASLVSDRHDFYCLQNEIRQADRQAAPGPSGNRWPRPGSSPG